MVRGGDGDRSVRGCGARPLGVDVRRASERARTHTDTQEVKGTHAIIKC